MSRGITISLYLVDADPSGIVCAYLSNWTGQCIKFPRTLLESVKGRKEVNSMGVYFLFGISEDNPDDRIVYIGEADNIYRRLVQHINDEEKAFWTETVVFTSKDDFLTKGHVKYLEHQLINMAKQNSNYNIHNKNNATKSALPEMAVSDMETFLDNIKTILPSIGYNILKESSFTKKSSKNNLYLEISGLKAKAYSTNTGFLVLEGSEVSEKVKDSLSIGYKNKRELLLEKGILTKNNDKLVFSKDYEFSSPSTAAAIIVGYAINGRQVWKDKYNKSLKEIEEENLE